MIWLHEKIVLIGNKFDPMSIVFFILLIGGTFIYFSILAIRPLIRPDLFPSTNFEIDSTLMEHWWNTYSHPRVVKVGMGLNTSTAQQLYGVKENIAVLTPGTSSNKQVQAVQTEYLNRDQGGKNFQTEEIERKRREQMRDDLMQAIAKQQSVGARAKKEKKKTAVDELNKHTRLRRPNDPPEARQIIVDTGALQDAELRRYFEKKGTFSDQN